MEKNQIFKRKNEDKNSVEKRYENILLKIVKKNNKINLLDFERNNIKVNEFKDYFLNNEKISRFLGIFLPSILFLIISLVSFSLGILSQNSPNLGFGEKSTDFWIVYVFFGSFFLILGLILLLQDLVFKIRVVRIKNGRQKGYHNISKKRYEEIINFLHENSTI